MDRGDGHPMTYGFTSTLGSLDADGIVEDGTPPVMRSTPPAAVYASGHPGHWRPADEAAPVRERDGKGDGATVVGTVRSHPRPGSNTSTEVLALAQHDQDLAEQLDRDGFLEAVPYDPTPDGPRYSAMGDAVTVNVLHWIAAGIVAEADAHGGLYAVGGIEA